MRLVMTYYLNFYHKTKLKKRKYQACNIRLNVLSRKFNLSAAASYPPLSGPYFLIIKACGAGRSGSAAMYYSSGCIFMIFRA